MAKNIHCFGVRFDDEVVRELYEAGYASHNCELSVGSNRPQSVAEWIEENQDKVQHGDIVMLGFGARFSPLRTSQSLKEHNKTKHLYVILYIRRNQDRVSLLEPVNRLAEGGDKYDADLVWYDDNQNLIGQLNQIFGNSLSASKASPTPQGQKQLITNIDVFVTALQENIIAVENRLNTAPAFDLSLSEDQEFKEQIEKLIGVLEEIRDLLSKGQEKIPEKKKTLAEEGLREFTLKLCGSVGTGLGNTVTWGTRVSLGLTAVYILQNLGLSPGDLSEKITQHIPDLPDIIDL